MIIIIIRRRIGIRIIMIIRLQVCHRSWRRLGSIKSDARWRERGASTKEQDKGGRVEKREGGRTQLIGITCFNSYPNVVETLWIASASKQQPLVQFTDYSSHSMKKLIGRGWEVFDSYLEFIDSDDDSINSFRRKTEPLLWFLWRRNLSRAIKATIEAFSSEIDCQELVNK